MGDNEQASVSVVKIICILVVFMMVTGISVMASNSKINNVKVLLSNNQTLDIVTTKTKVADILEENHIIVMPEEHVVPDLEEEITENNEIKILRQAELEEKPGRHKRVVGSQAPGSPLDTAYHSNNSYR